MRRFKNVCAFQEAVKTPSGNGGEKTEWQERFKRFGALAFAKMSVQHESIQQGALTSTTRATLTILEDADTREIDTGWRVQIAEGGYGNKLWNIREIQRVRAGFLRMVVESGVSV